MNKATIKRTITLLLFIVCYQAVFSQSSISETIYFKQNSATLHTKYLTVLSDLVAKCKADTVLSIKIYGYADTTGADDYNDKLSKKRAYAVYNYLTARNIIDTTKIYMEWLGESSDSYDLHFPEAHIQQKCVDIRMIFRRKQD